MALGLNYTDVAISDFSEAIAVSPNEPRYRVQRARAYFRQHKTALGMADLDEALRLAPEDVGARIERAGEFVKQQEKDAALTDLDVADRAADPGSMLRLILGASFIDAGQPRRAIGQFNQWLKAHSDDSRRPSALNARCFARALAGQELDVALRDCNAALRASPGTANFLDSRGIVELRRGEYAKAKADFDAALAMEPKLPWSLYGRSILLQRSGNAAAGAADIATAVAIRPHIIEEASGYGISR